MTPWIRACGAGLLVGLCIVLGASAVPALESNVVSLPSGERWIGDEIVVQLDRPITPAIARGGRVSTGIVSVDAVSRLVGAVGIRPFFRTPPADRELASRLGLDNLWVVTIRGGRNVFLAAERYLKAEGVVWASPNGYMSAAFDPNDPYFHDGHQWGPQKIDCPQAWDIGRGAADVVIAIDDTGVDYDHPDLQSKIQLPGYSAFNGGSDAHDDYGHGTHCAGIAAAITNNAVGIAGVCVDCRILPVKVLDNLGGGSWDTVAAGVIWATDHGAHVISQSIQGGGGEAVLENAMNYAYLHNVVLVSAAGNWGSETYSYPGAYDVGIAVAASDPDDSRASFSNYGSWVDVAAPGAAIYSTMPTYIVTLNYYGYSTYYDYMDGTSMACPHVAGLAGLLVGELGVGASNDEVRRLIEENCDPVKGSQYVVWGRVNARKSLEAAGSVVASAPAGYINPGWVWLSFPNEPIDPDPASILGYSAVANRLYRWDAVAKNLELYPDDFVSVESGRGYAMFVSAPQNPSYRGRANADGFLIDLPEAGWTWIGQPYDKWTPQANTEVHNNATGVTRSALSDHAAPDPWVNWNWILWDPWGDQPIICIFNGSGDTKSLGPWRAYRVWSNVRGLTLIMHG
jgi:thermitase